MLSTKLYFTTWIMRAKNIGATLLLSAPCILLFMFPRSACSGITLGINYCVNILVPSLFPFIIISSFAVKSGLTERLKKVFSGITKFLFYVPGAAGPTIILSLIGGYPAGAAGIKSLLQNKEINEEQAQRMLGFAVNAGPAFIISAVGGGLLKNPSAGLLIFLSQTISSVIIGILTAVQARIQKTPMYSKKTSTKNERFSISEAVIESCADAAHATLNMCALIIMFSAMLSVLKYINVFDFLSLQMTHLGVSYNNAYLFLLSLFEVTAACTQAAKLNSSAALIAFAVAWGGICIHFQIKSILKNLNFSYKRFCFFRIINALISALLTGAGLKFFKNTILVFSNVTHAPASALSSSAYGSIALILLCVYFTVNLLLRRKK